MVLIKGILVDSGCPFFIRRRRTKWDKLFGVCALCGMEKVLMRLEELAADESGYLVGCDCRSEDAVPLVGPGEIQRIVEEICPADGKRV
jgi:hypothetical protein